MINEKKLESLYNFLTEKNIIKTQDLKKIGFNSNDIKDLIELKIICRTARGCYKFIDIPSLCKYGKKIFKGNQEEAEKYFDIILHLDENNIDSNYYKFYYSIRRLDYTSSLTYLKRLYCSGKKHVNKDAMLYIYILNMITELPAEFLNIRKNINISDLEIDSEDNRYPDAKTYNDLITLIWFKKMGSTTAKIVNSFKDQVSIEFMIIKVLSQYADMIDKNFRNDIFGLLEEKNFERIYDILSKRDKRCVNNSLAKFELVLVSYILQIQKSKKIPTVIEEPTESAFIAINNCDFQKALELSNNYNKSAGVNNKNDILNLLLVEICNLIEEIKLNEKADQSSINETGDAFNENSEESANIDVEINEYENLYQSVLKEGMVLLNPLSEEDSDKIKYQMDYYPDIEIFTVKDGDISRIAIRNKSLDIPDIDIKETFSNGKIYFCEGQYEKCIECYLNLLKLSFVRSYAYALIGLCYQKMNNMEKALDFLLVAEHISKKENNGESYKVEIQILKNTLKPKVTEEPSVILEKYIIESNVDIETASQNLGLSIEEAYMNILNLVQTYYSQENYDKGDQLYQIVEESLMKTNSVLQSLIQTKRNKYRYKQESDTEQKTLSLTIEPKK